MKLIHTADWHLGKNIEGHSRLEEQRLFLKDFINICEEEQADIIIIAGDIYDNYNPSAMAEQLFYDTLKQLSRNGDCMTVVIAGNHDNPERLVASGPLARDHGIVMAGTPNSVITPGMYGKNEITESAAGYIHAIIHGEEADILLVPFPSEKRLNEVYLDETEEETKKAASYSEKMSSLFGSLATHFHEDSIHLIASHLFVMTAWRTVPSEVSSLAEATWSAVRFSRKMRIILLLDTFISHRKSPAARRQDTAVPLCHLTSGRLLLTSR